MKNYAASVPGIYEIGNTKQKRFKVYKTMVGLDIQCAYTRRDFAKIYLIAGQSYITFEGKAIQVNDPILFFEPLAPYCLKEVSGAGLGFVCVFSKDLLQCELCLKTYRQLMAFAATSGPVFFRLDSKQKHVIAGIFEQLMAEQDTFYTFSHELFCNYMNLILHEVLKKKTFKTSGYRPFHFN